MLIIIILILVPLIKSQELMPSPFWISSERFQTWVYLANPYIYLKPLWRLRNNDIHYLLKHSTSICMIFNNFRAISVLPDLLIFKSILLTMHDLQMSKDRISKDSLFHQYETKSKDPISKDSLFHQYETNSCALSDMT